MKFFFISILSFSIISLLYLASFQYREKANRKVASSSSILSDVSMPEIKTLLQKNPGMSLEEFLAVLPEDYRKHFTLMYHSLSIQSADFSRPRAIMFGKDASTVMSFNGDESQSLGNSLEILSFNKANDEFELYHIEFPVRVDETFEKNPPKCLLCHSSAPKPYGEVKPIWEVYPNWPGAYGSFNDHLFSKRDPRKKSDKIAPEKWPHLIREAREFFKFRQTAMDHPRYRHLVFEPDDRYYPFRSENADKASNGLNRRANFLLGVLLMGHNVRKIARLIRQTPVYRKFKFSLLGERLGCVDVAGFSYAHSQFIRRDLAPYLELIYPKVANKFRDFKKRIRKFDLNGDIPPFMFHWNMDFEETPDSYFNGFAGAEEYFILNTVLLQEEAKEHPELAKSLVVQSWIRNLPSFFLGTPYKEILDQVTPSHDFNEFKKRGGCGFLAQKSKQEWDSFNIDKASWNDAVYEEIDPAYYVLFHDPARQLEKLSGVLPDEMQIRHLIGKELGPKALKAFERRHDPVLERRYGCIDCHSGPLQIGPSIGMGKAKPRDMWHDAVLPGELGRRMPLGRRPLNEFERQQFYQYLK